MTLSDPVQRTSYSGAFEVADSMLGAGKSLDVTKLQSFDVTVAGEKFSKNTSGFSPFGTLNLGQNGTPVSFQDTTIKQYSSNAALTFDHNGSWRFTDRDGKFRGGGNCHVDPVPLPAALPLFGTALLGVGFVGWRKRSHVGGESQLVA